MHTGTKRGFPGLPFLFAAATNAAAQGVFSTLTDEELGITEDVSSDDTATATNGHAKKE